MSGLFTIRARPPYVSETNSPGLALTFCTHCSHYNTPNFVGVLELNQAICQETINFRQEKRMLMKLITNNDNMEGAKESSKPADMHDLKA